MEKFIQEYRENPVFTDQCFGYTRLLPEEITFPDGRKERVETGALIKENGDIFFKIYAPKATEVRINITIDPETPDLFLIKDETGFFTGNLPYSKRLAGPKTVNIYIDGALILYPTVPIFYWYGRPANYIEVPDEKEMFLLERNIPHGSVTKEYYYSKTMESWESCLVYTPPMYDPEKTYPVLYLQHGHTENEISWIYNGKANYIFDNLVFEEKAVPFIVIMNNGMIRKNNEPDYSYFEKMIIEDCMPVMEEKYHIRKSPEFRAIAGLSMGSAQASVIGFGHPELFANVGLFSGFLALLIGAQPKKHEEWPHLQMMRTEQKQFCEDYRVFFRSVGALDPLKVIYDRDEAFMKSYGITELPNLTSKVYEDRFHDWAVWREALRDFSQMIFKN